MMISHALMRFSALRNRRNRTENGEADLMRLRMETMKWIARRHRETKKAPTFPPGPEFSQRFRNGYPVSIRT
jgi:hypothetical protein